MQTCQYLVILFKRNCAKLQDNKAKDSRSVALSRQYVASVRLGSYIKELRCFVVNQRTSRKADSLTFALTFKLLAELT